MRRKQVSYVLSVLTISILLSGFACQTNYAKVGKLAKDFAASVLVAQEVEKLAFNEGKIDPATHAAINAKLVQMADAGTRLDAAISQSHNAAGAAAEVKVVEALLSDLSTNEITGIKNENARISLQSALLAVRVIIDNIVAFGG